MKSKKLFGYIAVTLTAVLLIGAAAYLTKDHAPNEPAVPVPGSDLPVSDPSDDPEAGSSIPVSTVTVPSGELNVPTQFGFFEGSYSEDPSDDSSGNPLKDPAESVVPPRIRKPPARQRP